MKNILYVSILLQAISLLAAAIFLIVGRSDEKNINRVNENEHPHGYVSYIHFTHGPSEKMQYCAVDKKFYTIDKKCEHLLWYEISGQ